MAEGAREALQSEYDRLLRELGESEATVRELEGRLREEGRRAEEEAGRSSQTIAQLREQLRASEEQRQGQEEKVSDNVRCDATVHHNILRVLQEYDSPKLST